MKIELSNEEMAAAVEAMQASGEKGKLAYAIARNTRKLKAESSEYVSMRNDLFVKYGTDTGNGKYEADTEAAKKIRDELGDIPALKSEVDVFTVDEETFTGGNLASWQMERLLWMVEQGKEKEDGRKKD